ncbi:MAG: hypothetical protein A4E71_02349 [Smithella sp. PtaU1.Bin162]|nr:MAG: hypothetical protein A4E71_02349 [Smithella sp. PtaU1.Bin162]
MSNDIIRIKSAKLLAGDTTTQASIINVLDNNRLIVEAAQKTQAHAPLINACLKLYETAQQKGLGEFDMISVIKSFETIQ